MKDIKDKIEELIKNGWSYGKLAKELGVSKTTIARWYKGECNPSYPYYEEQLDYLLRQPVRKDCQIDYQKDIVDYFMKQFEHPIMVIRSENDTIQAIEEIDSATLDKHIAFCEKRLAELKAQKEKNKWKFTEDEKVILRNLDKKFKWIARDKGDYLYVYQFKPEKSSSCDEWHCIDGIWGMIEISEFNHLFQCIKYSDTEPCEFRKFI